MVRRVSMLFAAAALVVGSVATAGTPRDTLTEIAFTAKDKPSALAGIAHADAQASAALARAPQDREAMMVRAMATSYRAQLGKSRADAFAAKAMLEKLVASDPKDAEALEALGGWHLGSIAALGPMLARMVLGAKKAEGYAAIDRAVALDGKRAMVSAVAGMMRLQLDPADAKGVALIHAAMHGETPTYADRMMQQRACTMAALLKAGDESAVRKAAGRLLPMGQLNG